MVVNPNRVKRFYEVIVGNVGKVHEGESKVQGIHSYGQWARKSKLGEGRAAHEVVTLYEDGEPIKEYMPDTAEYASN